MTEPLLATTSPDGGRTYRRPSTGQVAPSVTTVLKVLDKPALPRWASRTAAEYAWSQRERWQELPEAEAIKLIAGSPWGIRDKAAGQGTTIHAGLEALLKREPPPAGVPIDAVLRLEQFIDRHKPEVLVSEGIVWGETELPHYGESLWAGSFDLVCVIEDEVWLIDLKTGKGIYPEMRLQLIAYALAQRWLIVEDGSLEVREIEALPIDRFGILHVPNGIAGWTLAPLDIDVPDVEAWLAAYRLWRWQGGT